MKQVDARGQLCPMPVLMVQNEIKASQPTSLEVLVDDGCAVENVTRFASNHGYSVKKKPTVMNSPWCWKRTLDSIKLFKADA